MFVRTFYGLCGLISFVSHFSDLYSRPNSDDNSVSYQLRGIECHINNNEVIDCRKDKDEVFIPFSFIKKYFEVLNLFQ